MATSKASGKSTRKRVSQSKVVNRFAGKFYLRRGAVKDNSEEMTTPASDEVEPNEHQLTKSGKYKLVLAKRMARRAPSRDQEDDLRQDEAEISRRQSDERYGSDVKEEIVAPRVPDNMFDVKVGVSGISGCGVFALRQFSAGEFIMSFLTGAGPVVTHSVTKGALEAHFVQIGEDAYILPTAPSLYLNHSCRPNTGVRNNTEIIALQDIRVGEELTFDYSTTMDEEDWEMECACQNEECRKRIRDFRLLDPETQNFYIERGVVGDFCLRVSGVKAEA